MNRKLLGSAAAAVSVGAAAVCYSVGSVQEESGARVYAHQEPTTRVREVLGAPTFHLPSARELTALYPDDLRLDLVQVTHRHGARTSGALRVDMHPVEWRCPPSLSALSCVDATQNASSSSRTDVAADPMPHVAPAAYQLLHYPDRQALKGTCYSGQLTEVGKWQLVELGARLRTLYSDQLGFIDVYCKDTVHIRATTIQRAIESVQHLLGAMFPLDKREKSGEPVIIHTVQERVETMYPNTGRCRRLGDLKKAWQRSQEYTDDFNPRSAALRKTFAKALGTEVEHLPSVHGLFDEFSCRVAHGIALPKGVTEEMVLEASHLSVLQWFGGFERSREMIRLGSGRFLNELITPLKVAPEQQSVRFMVFSGHDTTVAPLLVALDCFDGEWPRFAANVTLETFTERKTGKRFVRALYNGKVQKMGFCKETRKGSDGTLCALEEFIAHLQAFVPVSYADECKSVEESK